MISISVLVPLLNVVDYVRECFDSIINQSYRDFEVICIDAGSNDGTLDVIKEYVVKYDCFLLIQSDVKSYGYQLNLGIKNAYGKYIAIVEPDDYISEDMLDCLYRNIKEHELDYVKAGYYQFFDLKNRRIQRKIIRKESYHLCGKVLNNDFNEGVLDINHIWSGLYDRDFLIKNRIWFNETPGASFQDTSFSILVGLLAKRFMYIDDAVYFYRTDNGNSSVKSDKKVACVIDEYKYIECLLIQHGIYESVKAIVLNLKINTYMWNYRRLSKRARSEFVHLIQDELLEMNRTQGLLSQSSIEYLNIFNNEEDFDMIENPQYSFAKLVDEIKKGKRYNIVSAGNLTESLIEFQEWIQKDFINAICDNSVSKQGQKIGKYQIHSVERLFDEESEHKCEWLIANKYYSDEIRQQLIQMGIHKNQIFILKMITSLDEMRVAALGFLN